MGDKKKNVRKENLWNSGEAPRDGETYVAMGRVVWSADHSGGSIPFLSQVRYVVSEGWKGWLDDRDLAISEGVDDRVCIDYWIPLPGAENFSCGSEIKKFDEFAGAVGEGDLEAAMERAERKGDQS